MADRRNPYLILGLDFGASPQQAQAAFAKLSRKLRRETSGPYQIEDATWALHEIEHAATDPDVNLAVFRVPANPDAYRYQPADGVLTVAPQNLPRRTGSSEAAVARLRADVAEEIASVALGAAVENWEATGRVEAPPDPDPVAPETGAAAAQPGPGQGGAALPVTTPARRVDPLAVALGNATLLGVGHMLLRRWGPAVLTIGIATVLLAFLAGFGQPGWFWRVVLVLWWVTTIAHGWRLARRAAPEPVAAGHLRRVRRQRAIAAAATLAVVAGSIVVAVDARRIEARAADAHQAGDCESAVESLDGIGGRHRIVDPYLTRRTGGDAEACALLLAAYADAEADPPAAAEQVQRYLDHPSARWDGAPGLRADLLLTAAEAELADALAGTVPALATGFDLLAEVLETDPGRAEGVATVLTDYVAQLPTVDPCEAKLNIDWLVDREPTGDELDRPGEQAQEVAPSVFLACGDQLVETDPSQARAAYQALLDDYPDHELVDDARQGRNAAQTLIEEEIVSDLISRDAYCEDPSRYRGAPAYRGNGPHLVLVFGPESFRDAIPSDWLAEDHTDVGLVLCVDGPENGRVVQTCAYQGDATNPGPVQVQLRANRYTVEAFEVNTGERAIDTTVETASGGCPSVLTWSCPALNPNCPPPGSIRADHNDGQVRSAVESWVFP